MTAPARPLITDLPKGHEFDIDAIDVTPDGVDRYLAAVEDANTVYAESGLAPPVAVAAIALKQLLDMIELPDGTLHIGQEIEMHGGVPIGSKLSMRGWIAQRSVRQGAVISVIEFALTPDGKDAPVLTGRTTAMVTGAST